MIPYVFPWLFAIHVRTNDGTADLDNVNVHLAKLQRSAAGEASNIPSLLIDRLEGRIQALHTPLAPVAHPDMGDDGTGQGPPGGRENDFDTSWYIFNDASLQYHGYGMMVTGENGHMA